MKVGKLTQESGAGTHSAASKSRRFFLDNLTLWQHRGLGGRCDPMTLASGCATFSRSAVFQNLNLLLLDPRETCGDQQRLKNPN